MIDYAEAFPIRECRALRSPTGRIFDVLYREGTNDLDNIRACLEEDAYCFREILHCFLPERVPLCALDLGANIGGATLALAACGLRVLAVELLPENCDLLWRNIKRNDLEWQVKVCNAAIVNESDPRDRVGALYGTVDCEEHYFIGATNARHQEPDAVEWVETRHFVEIMARYGMRDVLVKIDIEGGEWDLFDGHRPPFGAESFCARVPVIVAELHDRPPEHRRVFCNLVNDWLARAGVSYPRYEDCSHRFPNCPKEHVILSRRGLPS